MFRTSNPTLREDIFAPAEGLSALGGEATRPATMTIGGAINRSCILISMCLGAAVFSWSLVLPGAAIGSVAAPKINPFILLMGGLLGAVVLSFSMYFKPKASPFLAPIHALFEGVFVGAISALYAQQFAVDEAGALTDRYGIVINAVVLTFGVLGVMLIGYRAGIIKVTKKFQLFMGCAIGAVCLLYLVNFVMFMFGSGVPFLHSSGPIGIGVSVVIVGIAALSLALDFEFIVQASRRGAPKYMEWYAGFALLTSLVWLYLEILRLLAKLQSRD